jgi:hypothetical protein
MRFVIAMCCFVRRPWIVEGTAVDGIVSRRSTGLLSTVREEAIYREEVIYRPGPSSGEASFRFQMKNLSAILFPGLHARRS